MMNLAVRCFWYVFRVIKNGLLILLLYPFFWLAHFRTKGCHHAPVFIIGAPRTGSTILYQALTNCYDVKYIDNVASGWFRLLPFGMWLSSLRYGMKPHNNYLAELGNTLMFGGHAPSECGDFWYRWFSSENHFVDARNVPKSLVREIRRELNLIMSKYSKPLLFKNLNMGQRLQLIKEIYPDAKIIFIRRDPRFVVRSILVAREKLGLDPDEWWSVRPPNHERFIGLPEIEMCAAQVFYIEDQIKKDLEILDSNNVFTIQFNQLSEEKIDEIASALGLTKKQGTLMPIFQKDEVSSLSSPEFASIGSAIQKFEFEKELFV